MNLATGDPTLSQNIARAIRESGFKGTPGMFKEIQASGFERKVGSIVEAVAVAATKMQGLSSTMSASSTETTSKTAAAAKASDQASTNVETVLCRVSMVEGACLRHHASRPAPITPSDPGQRRT